MFELPVNILEVNSFFLYGIKLQDLFCRLSHVYSKLILTVIWYVIQRHTHTKNLAEPYGYILFTFFQKAKTFFGFLSVIENRC